MSTSVHMGQSKTTLSTNVFSVDLLYVCVCICYIHTVCMYVCTYICKVKADNSGKLVVSGMSYNFQYSN